MMKKALITFGRFQPPTIGHDKLFKKLVSISGSDVFVFGSPKQDRKKNPLTPRQKKFWLEKVTPQRMNVVVEKDITDILKASWYISKEGYDELIVVVGQDRKMEFQRLLNKYNNASQPNGMDYSFNKITVRSAGLRNPDADNVSGASASKARDAVANDDFESFSKVVSGKLNQQDKEKLFKELQP